MTSSIAIIIPANLRVLLAGHAVKLIGASKPSNLLARIEAIYTRPERIDFTNLSFALAQKASFADGLAGFHERSIIGTMCELDQVQQALDESTRYFQSYNYGSDVEAVQLYHASMKLDASLEAEKKVLQKDTLSYGRMVQKATKPGASESEKEAAVTFKSALDARRADFNQRREAHKKAYHDAKTSRYFACIVDDVFEAGLAHMRKRDELEASRVELLGKLAHSVACYAGRVSALSANAIVI